MSTGYIYKSGQKKLSIVRELKRNGQKKWMDEKNRLKFCLFIIILGIDMFQVFHRYVAIVSCGCCKCRSRCCICYNGCTRMLQSSNVSSAFSDICCNSVLPGCWLRFIHMLQVFYLDIAYVLQWFFSCFLVFFSSVSEACFKCFMCLQTYVASVASRCFKSKSDVASPSSLSCCLTSVSYPSLSVGWASATPYSSPPCR
jgi:hypothetical protein